VVGSGCQLIDDGGVIGLYAQTVDQNGLIQANSVGNQHGVIELVASNLLTLGANSVIQANGDNSPDGSAGGQIMLQTAQTFSDDPDSQIQARGGANGRRRQARWLFTPHPRIQTRRVRAGWFHRLATH